jgi:hypothetical protein
VIGKKLSRFRAILCSTLWVFAVIAVMLLVWAVVIDERCSKALGSDPPPMMQSLEGVKK